MDKEAGKGKEERGGGKEEEGGGGEKRERKTHARVRVRVPRTV